MADHASALKRHRQSLKKRDRNRATKSKLATIRKKVEKATTKEEGLSFLKQAIRAFAKAGQKGVMHKKTASRRISLLTKLVNKLAA